MPRILLNDRAIDSPPPSSAVTWEEVLGGIDASIEGSGHVITAVRFDGLEEPGFRDPVVTGRLLGPEAIVEIETGPSGQFLQRCLADAADSLPILAHAARQIGERFRAFEVAEANRALVDLAESLGTMVALVATSSVAAGVPLQQLRVGQQSVADLVTELHTHVEAVATAQLSGDWLNVADILQDEVARVLNAWPDVFAALAQESVARAPARRSA
jgi:hypothetical protein